MSSKILTVSNINGTASLDNAEILTTFNPPIDIKNDTLLNFKTGFIDVVGLGNTGEDIFKVTETINANIAFSYYEQFVDKANTQDKYDFVTGRGINISDSVVPYGNQYLGMTFALYQFVTYPNTTKSEPFIFNRMSDYQEINLIQSNISININQGSYTSDSIVEYLNIALQSSSKGFLEYSPTQYGTTFKTIMDNFNQYIPFKTLVERYSETAADGFYRKFLVFVGITQTPIFFPPTTATLPPRFEADDAPFYAYTYEHRNPPAILVGTPFLSIQNTEDLLQFTYTHNPFYNDASRTQTIQLQKINQVDIVAGAQTSYVWFTKRGGINITDLQPRNFWFDLLGFDESILLKPNNIVITGCNVDSINLLGISSFDVSTTKPFIGIADFDSALDNITTTAYNELTKDIRITVTNTVGINAVNPINYSDLDNGGHLLLQCEIGSKMNNFFDSDTQTSIISIMSKEYLNNGFISVFDGGIPVMLNSNTCISYIKIRIIDPITKKNVINIGGRNTFYFELSQ
jgi:hypothetical protein